MTAVGGTRGASRGRAAWRRPRLGHSRGVMLGGGLAAGAIAGATVAVLGPVITIGIVAGLVAAAAALAMPGTLLAAYLLIPFYKGAVQPYLPIDLTVILAGANALQLLPVLFDRRSRGVSRTGIVLWLALAGLVLAGTTWAPDPTIAFKEAGTFWILVTIPLGIACLRVGAEPRFVRQLAWSFFALALLAVAIGTVSLSSADRLVVLGMNTIQVAVAAMLVPLIGIGYVFSTGRTWLQLLTIGAIPFAVVVALASGSRGPILTLAILALFAGAVQMSRARVIRPRVVVGGLVGGGVLVLVLVVASAALPAQALQRFSLFGSFLGSLLGGDTAPTGDTSSEARARLIGVAARIFVDHPLVGSGTTGFAQLSPRYVGPLLADRYPHNSVMQFASEFGLLGTALFVAIVAVALLRRTPPGRAWALVRALALYFVLNSLLSNDILEDRMTWGLLLLLLVARVAPGDAAEPAPGGAAEPAPAVAVAGTGPAGGDPPDPRGDR